jgi:hypothetical protein
LPIPDPSTLTTAMLLREISNLRAVLASQIGGQRDVFEARLAGMDEAIKLLQTIEDRRPKEMEALVQHLHDLMNERFGSVDKQFMERDTRTEQAAASTKTAVDAALQAQKEAAGEQNKSLTLSIDKTERGTQESIRQNADLQASNYNGLRDLLGGLDTRLTKIESLGLGAQQQRGESHTSQAAVLAYVLAAFAIGGFVLTLVRDFGAK